MCGFCPRKWAALIGAIRTRDWAAAAAAKTAVEDAQRASARARAAAGEAWQTALFDAGRDGRWQYKHIWYQTKQKKAAAAGSGGRVFF